jgi:hypothetical protein
MRLAHNLPQHALFAQLEAVLRQMLSVSDMLLIRLDNQRLETLSTPSHTTMTSSGHVPQHQQHRAARRDFYWYSLPLRQQQQYFAHLIIKPDPALGNR